MSMRSFAPKSSSFGTPSGLGIGTPYYISGQPSLRDAGGLADGGDEPPLKAGGWVWLRLRKLIICSAQTGSRNGLIPFFLALFWMGCSKSFKSRTQAPLFSVSVGTHTRL